MEFISNVVILGVFLGYLGLPIAIVWSFIRLLDHKDT